MTNLNRLSWPRPPGSRRPMMWILAPLLVASVVACGGGGGGDAAPTLNVNAAGVSTFDGPVLNDTLAGYPLQTVSAAEAEGLAYMREEEQLAHAVYTASAARWAVVPAFTNIASSEATHTAAVKALLDRYGLADPLQGLPIGSFAAPVFQTLYANLTAAGSVSLVEALKVGVQIEELDISDIAARKAGADNADILLVYDNLMRGSRNHLRAFMTLLIQQGGSYTPRYISQAEFDSILNSAIESGR